MILVTGICSGQDADDQELAEALLKQVLAGAGATELDQQLLSPGIATMLAVLAVFLSLGKTTLVPLSEIHTHICEYCDISAAQVIDHCKMRSIAD